MKTYTFNLPDEFAGAVDRMLAEGKFGDLDHLMLYAVSLVDDEVRRDDLEDKDWLRAEIQKGLADSAAGRTRPMDMKAIRARVRADLESEREGISAAPRADPAG